MHYGFYHLDSIEDDLKGILRTHASAAGLEEGQAAQAYELFAFKDTFADFEGIVGKAVDGNVDGAATPSQMGGLLMALRVRGEADELAETIKSVKGVRKVETLEDGGVEFEFASGKDLRPEVAKQVIKDGYDLLELRPLGMSLEEIFLELTGNEGKR